MTQEDAVYRMRFRTESADACIYCTVIYAPHLSNIRGRHYDMEVSNKAFQRRELILSIYINMSSCSKNIYPLWSVSIEQAESSNHIVPPSANSTYYVFLYDFLLGKYHDLHDMFHMFPVWYLVHMIKPDPNVIWRVWIEACHTVSYVSIEVPTDNYLSTSVYNWNHHNNSDNVYMTINRTVSILFELDDIIIMQNVENYFTFSF